MKKKNLIMLFLAIIMSLSLVACSSNATTDSVETDNQWESFDEVFGMPKPDSCLDSIEYNDVKEESGTILYTYLLPEKEAQDIYEQYQAILVDDCGFDIEVDENEMVYISRNNEVVSAMMAGTDEDLGNFFKVSFPIKDKTSVENLELKEETLVNVTYGIPADWVKEDKSSDDVTQYWYIPDESNEATQIGIMHFNIDNTINTKSQASSYLELFINSIWVEGAGLSGECSDYDKMSVPAKYGEYASSDEQYGVDTYCFLSNVDDIIIVSYIYESKGAKKYSDEFKQIIDSIKIENSDAEFWVDIPNSKSDSSSNGSGTTNSKSTCGYKYSDGSVCGAPTNKYNGLCDRHFEELDDTYNSLVN